MPPGNAKFLMDSVFGLAIRMNQFALSDAEIGLFCAVVIITPGESSTLLKPSNDLSCTLEYIYYI